MSDPTRRSDLDWFLGNRRRLAREHDGKWLVVKDQGVAASFDAPEDAASYAVERFGVDAASIFEATPEDPLLYFGCPGPS